jgi:hypothetical protein
MLVIRAAPKIQNVVSSQLMPEILLKFSMAYVEILIKFYLIEKEKLIDSPWPLYLLYVVILST